MKRSLLSARVLSLFGSRFGSLFLISLALALAGCPDNNGGGGDAGADLGGLPDGSAARSFEFEFRGGKEGWAGEFVDLPAADRGNYELAFEARNLPAPLTTTEGALYLAGNNHSDDLFMFAKVKLTGLRPDTKYSLAYQVRIASNAQSGCTGIGGAPGESVYLKVGASAVEPIAVTDNAGYHRLNVDKGQQSQGGPAAVVLGNIANGDPCNGQPVYRIQDLTSGQSPQLTATTDGQGNLWAFVGTDSGYEGLTALYYDRVAITLAPQ